MQVGLPPTPLPILQLILYTGQSSQNKLIVFADGTYLELFCWISKPQEFYAWANKSPGLIDFALTSLPPSTAQSLHKGITSRLKESSSGDEPDLSYTSPEAGSRRRQDDVQVKWDSSRPVSSKSVKRTDFPFFCHDVTPRSVRVPFDDEKKTRHPCGAVGISGVEVIVPNSGSDVFAELYGHVLDASTRFLSKQAEGGRLDFEIGLPVQGFGPSTISLRSEQDGMDEDWLRDRGTGIRNLLLSVGDREGHGKEALGTEGIASTISLKW